jgi:hypothetical protein
VGRVLWLALCEGSSNGLLACFAPKLEVLGPCGGPVLAAEVGPTTEYVVKGGEYLAPNDSRQKSKIKSHATEREPTCSWQSSARAHMRKAPSPVLVETREGRFSHFGFA